MNHSNITFFVICTLLKLSFQYTIPFFKNSSQPLYSKQPYTHLLYTTLCIGTPMKCFPIPIHFNLYPSWLCGSFYQIYDSLTYTLNDEQEGLYCSFTSFISKRAEDIVQIANNTQFRLNYYYADSFECSRKGLIGEIGFAFRPTISIGKFGNIIEQMYYNKLINRQTIIIQYNNATNGNIIIGESLDNYSHINRCIELITHSYSLTELANRLSHINLINTQSQLLNVAIDIDSNIKISISYQLTTMLVPITLFNKITAKILSEAFLDGECIYSIYDDNNLNEAVYCNKEVMDLEEIGLKQIEFVFDTKAKLIIPLKDFFIEQKNHYVFGIIGEREKESETITIGDIILRKYHLYYERDTKMIRMYAIDDVYKHNSSLNQATYSIRLLFSINIVICIIWSIICSILYYMVNTKIIDE